MTAADMPSLASKLYDLEGIVAGLISGRQESKPILLTRAPDGEKVWLMPHAISSFGMSRHHWKQWNRLLREDVEYQQNHTHIQLMDGSGMWVSETCEQIAMLLGGDVQLAKWERAA